MKFSQETLMAYADGELDGETRRAIEAEMAADPQLAREVERQRALRADVGAAFAGVLDEQIPDRLLRAAKKSRVPAQPRRWSWPEWTSIAASLVIGVIAGRAILQSPEGTEGIVATASDGHIVAQGQLAQALSEQLSSEDGAGVDIGLTFRSKAGEYCRTFGTRTGMDVVGFACRDADAWRIDMLSTTKPTEAGGNYRMASTQLPAPIVQAIAERMQGEALDADQEAIARQRRWRD
jgi:hypothetical protein